MSEEMGLGLVLTPTARLARAENLKAAREQVGRGALAWARTEILGFSAWVNQLRDDYFLLAGDGRVPIGAHQALALWQEVIDPDIFIGEPRVAEMAQGAWRLIHEFDLTDPGQWDALWMSEDNRRFREWASRFGRLCEQRGQLDEWEFTAQLPGLIESGAIPAPAALTLRGFDLPLTPVQQRILDALDSAGCKIERERPGGQASPLQSVFACTEPDEELRVAARWARDQVEKNPDCSVGVVVPELQGQLSRVERIFRQVFDPPGFAMSQSDHASDSQAFHVSLGHPLADWPLARQALLLLGLDPFRISLPQAGRLLRSPFMAGWRQERSARDRLLARLTRFAPYWIDVREIMHQASGQDAEILGGKLAAWLGLRRQHGNAASASQWVGRFQEELSSVGFGSGRTLDSQEFQVLERWHELLESFSQLDLVLDRPLSRTRALRWLGERARATVFRPRNPGAAVEILGIEEALGSRFDSLWITTVDKEHWPRPARRHPLIPGPAQADIPAATGNGCLERARLELEGLRRCAGQVVGSFSLGSGEQPMQITPLLDHCSITEVEPESAPVPVALETLNDDIQAPALTERISRGGTGVLQSQSDCPFKAFAGYRLRAEDLTPPRPGLNPMDRGSLLHRALEVFWRGLADQAALLALSEDALAARINQAVEEAIEDWARRHRCGLSQAGQQLEAQCLQRAIGHWLALEKQREPFSVNQLEAPVTLQFGSLELTGKIDRVDELEGGGTILIDYKTGQSSHKGWAPDARLTDVQLPAYAVNLDPRPVALAFARIRPEQMGFDGLAEVDAGMPGVEVIGKISRQPFKAVESWKALLKDWQSSLTTLADDFTAGHAEVDPRAPSVCRYCHLQSLCRIDERVMLRETDDE
jgi:ATP-dependent helicase/nuclease subunit B